MRIPDPDWLAALRAKLLAFYDERRRDLPWRRDPDPYRVWVSEVMLQQTRADTVIPYYERWLRRFPTLDALAAAEPDDVLKQWEGLGYYSRARNLQRAARFVRERHHGDVPSEPAALRELPGVGDYTAGAIASIAFGRAEPAVDGNARRVLSRLLDVVDPRSAALRETAATLVPDDRPGDFNQSVMELGATICTPRNPRCDECPIGELCRSRARGTQHLRPRIRRRAAVPTHDLAVAVVVAPGDELLLVQRPDRGLLAGLWCFPAAELLRDGDPHATHVAWGEGDDAGRAALALARRLIGDALRGPANSLGTLKHTFTHRREVYRVFRVSASARRKVTSGKWLTRAELNEHTLPTAQRKIARLIG